MSRESKGMKRQLTQEVILDPQRRVRELSEMGSSVKVDKAFPVKRYFRSGSEMERQARVYYAEGQLDKAFILYNKFVTLFLEKLPKLYPDYNKPEYRVDRAKIKKLVKEAFPRAEELKRKLLKWFEAEKEVLEEKLAQEAEVRRREEEGRRAAEQRQREEAEKRLREGSEKREREEAKRVAAFLAGGSEVSSDLNEGVVQTEGGGGNHTPLTAGLPQKDDAAPQNTNIEIERDAVESRDQITSNMPTLTLDERSPAVSDSSPEGRSLTATNPQLAQVLPPAYEGPPPPVQSSTAAQPPNTYLAPGVTQPSSGVQTYQSGPTTATDQSPYWQMAPPPTNPYYTSAVGQETQIYPGDPRMQYPPYYAQGATYQVPSTPGGPYVAQMSTASSSSWGSVELPPPSYHMTTQTTPTQTITEEEEEEEEAPPQFDRSLKPTASYNALSTSIGGGYRTVHVPESISRKFEEFASTNTRQNMETCGILAGKLSRNQLHVTHVILPKQRGGPDSCETLSEEELFDVQDQHDLLTLGWIHTHPSQTAFMSSVDLHTHCSYQIMLDEAIAIVCAPRYCQMGVYMLTEPYGLDYITHCEEEGFHTHPKEPPLYEECKHVVFSESPVDIVDLR